MMLYLSFLLLLLISNNRLSMCLGFLLFIFIFFLLLGTSIFILIFLNLLLVIILFLLFHLIFINLIFFHFYATIVPLLSTSLTIHTSGVSSHFTHIRLAHLIHIHFCNLLFVFLVTFEIFVQVLFV